MKGQLPACTVLVWSQTRRGYPKAYQARLRLK